MKTMKFILASTFALAIFMSSAFIVFAQQQTQTTMDTGGQTQTNLDTGQDTHSIGKSSFPNPFGNKANTDSLYGFVYFVLEKIVLPIGAVVVVFFVIYAGYLFVTAGGSEDKLDKAKHTLLAVVIGAAILLGSWTIATAIKGTLCEIAPNIEGLCKTNL